MVAFKLGIWVLIYCVVVAAIHIIAYPYFPTTTYLISSILGFSLLLSAALYVYSRRYSASIAKLKNIVESDAKNLDELKGANEVEALGSSISSLVVDMHKQSSEIFELAYVDRTTQLPNKEFFRRELTRSIKRSVRHSYTGALLFIDLDGFKQVNDTFGHQVGDLVLEQFSQRLKHTLRAEDLIGFDSSEYLGLDENEKQEENSHKQMLARLGGDEFTILLSEIREATDAAIVSERIIETASKPFEINGVQISIGASVGVSIFPQDGTDYNTIMKCADMAMYLAKDQGKNTYRYFSKTLNEQACEKLELEKDLRDALSSDGQLEVYYQPKVECNSKRVLGFEALVRWHHPSKGLLLPEQFLKIAEERALIVALDDWVLREAATMINKIQSDGLDLSVSVNISSAQLAHPDFTKALSEIIEERGIDARRLSLEFTEVAITDSKEMATEHFNALQKLGVGIEVDDFGIGYSSLATLCTLPINALKIDQTFIAGLLENDNFDKIKIIQSITTIANGLGYKVIAEGVETRSQMDFLNQCGCDQAQGFYFAEAMPASEISDWLENYNSSQTASDGKPKKTNTAA